MHNGTVPYFKQIKRSMLLHVSDRAYHVVQGTTDSEMMFAMFITNYERLIRVDEDESSSVDPCHSQDFSELPYEYTLNKEDHTLFLVSALRATLRQVHYLTLEHEYKTGIQKRPSSEAEPQELTVDGASKGGPLPETIAIGRLNLAVSDGQSTCTSRYVSSAPDTAHTLYYSTGSRYEITNHQCQVLITPPASPIMVPRTAGNKGSSRVLVVSSEPLAAGFNCEVVPINHAVVSGPNGFSEVVSCIE